MAGWRPTELSAWLSNAEVGMAWTIIVTVVATALAAYGMGFVSGAAFGLYASENNE